MNKNDVSRRPVVESRPTNADLTVGQTESTQLGRPWLRLWILVVALQVGGGAARPVAAQVDLDGTWDVTFSAFDLIPCPSVTFTQSGTTLTAVSGFFDTCGINLSGTIDPMTGSFTMGGQAIGCPFVFFSGFGAPDGATFGASFTSLGSCLMGSASGVRRCGNFIVDSGEACDDGEWGPNDDPEDCCISCLNAGPPQTCTDDGNPCTSDVCNGGDTPYCDHQPGNAGATCRSSLGACDVAETCDGSSATCPADAKSSDVCRPAAGPCDVAEICDGAGNLCPSDAFQSNGTGCPDGTFCNGAEQCLGGVCQPATAPCPNRCDELEDMCTCPSVAQSSCRLADKNILLLKDNPIDDGGDKLLWKWVNGQATSVGEFGSPSIGADYSLCVFVGSSGFLLFGGAADVAAGPEWQSTSTGWKYGDPSASQDGVHKILLKGSLQDKAKILVKGKGIALPDPLPIEVSDLPVIVQLLNDQTPVCWVSVFDSTDIIKHEVDQLKAKGDSAGLVCGDGQIDPLEQCDMSDDAACPGSCLPDCTCPPPCDVFDTAACSAYINSPTCAACCNGDPSCAPACTTAAQSGCFIQPAVGCTEAINAAGCADECCP